MNNEQLMSDKNIYSGDSEIISRERKTTRN
jgi:hypothetical protein